MRKWTKIVALAAIALFVAAGAFAQTTGRIEGTVQDSNGAPLPGVTLTATGPTLPGAITVISGQDGTFRMLAVPVGSYMVSAVLDGFNTVEQRDINVGIDRSSISGPRPWQYYHLYSLERAARVLGLTEVEGRAWDPEGARWLLGRADDLFIPEPTPAPTAPAAG